MLDYEAMNIRDFITQEGPERAKQLADKAGIQPGYLEFLAYTKNRVPSAKVAIKLEEASGGLITRQELRPDIFS